MNLYLHLTHSCDTGTHARIRQILAPLFDSCVAFSMSLDSDPHFPQYEMEITTGSTLKNVKML